MKIRIVCWLIVPALAGLVAHAARTWQLCREQARIANSEPSIEYPAKLDLGSHEIGDQAIAHFTIANRGGGELVLDEIQSNCSCTGMEREQDGHFGHVNSLRLKAGEQTDLVMRVAVRGVPVGAEMINVVDFRTNDPSQPKGHIEAIVRCTSGGVSATPRSIVFGTVPLGAKVRNIVEVYDNALTPRKIDRVTSTQSDRVIARLLPATERSVPSPSDPARVLIGRIEIVVSTELAGEVDGGVQIHLANVQKKPDAITVIGKVAAPIEISPTLLVLPRASTKGPIYEGTCVCRSTSEQPLSVTLKSVPPGLTVEVLDEGKAVRRVRIKGDPKQMKIPAEGQRETIRLRAKAGEHNALLEVQILLQT